MTKNPIEKKYQAVFNKFKNSKNELIGVQELYIPFWQCKQKIVAEKTVAIDRFTKIVLNIINAGTNKHTEICKFLGIDDDDFVTMQFHYLLKNGLVAENQEGYIITQNGIKFLKNKSSLQQLEIVDFDYFFNPITQTYLNRLKPIDAKLYKEKNNKFSGYNMLQTHKLPSSIKKIENKNRPTFNTIKQVDFAAYFNTQNSNMSFYDFENQDLKAYERSIAFLCLEYLNEDNQKEYEIRQFKKSVEKFNGYMLEETLSKEITAYLKHKPDFF
ncbi:winged helix-turn-helix domain-containing protein [uncultured Lacinutrix sp.]|uniref:winged helix-turn-helix domain-containing protein n=1 Tax=uncultured Lacinutrix sp. TaxID=574032 RepID=UPI0026205DBE|nr:winged helix-turn-helix domain-containing protein [uncultured Lacinutrix sp.]